MMQSASASKILWAASGIGVNLRPVCEKRVLVAALCSTSTGTGTRQLGGRRTEDEDDEQLVYLAIDS